MRTKLIGVTKNNPDGTNRQKLLAKAKEGDALYFEVETTPKKEKQIAVFNYQDQQLGYLMGKYSYLAGYIENEEEFSPVVAKITGGDGNKSYGCNIDIPELDEYGDYCPPDDNDDDEGDEEEDVPPAPLTPKQCLIILGIISFVLFLLSRIIHFK